MPNRIRVGLITSGNGPLVVVPPLDGHKLQDPTAIFRTGDQGAVLITFPPGDDRIRRVIGSVPT